MVIGRGTSLDRHNLRRALDFDPQTIEFGFTKHPLWPRGLTRWLKAWLNVVLTPGLTLGLTLGLTRG